MKDLNFAIEEYKHCDHLEIDRWKIIQVFAHKVDALNFVMDENNVGMYKITEVYGEVNY